MSGGRKVCELSSQRCHLGFKRSDIVVRFRLDLRNLAVRLPNSVGCIGQFGQRCILTSAED
ncbi:unnamed protein product, partial [Dicrocoelium dendriticum]